DASAAVAKNYEERKMFNEAYLKWWEISLHRETGAIGRDALLGMAQNKHATYNRHPEHNRSLYDASSLSTAQSSYERFRLLFPEDAARIGVDKILAGIYEQLAYKQLSIARYYQKVGNRQAANLYYEMVARDWALSKAAETARKMLAGNHDFTNKPQTPSEK
ncbi:MAG: outer membrane protein assembly factor BamD, partial [Planctomycetota bacterium]